MIGACFCTAPCWRLRGSSDHVRPAPPAKVKAVASFSILADMLRVIGGERVDAASLVGPNGDVHVYEPTPGDVRTLAGAAIFVVNGLGLEGWISRLETSSGFKGKG